MSRGTEVKCFQTRSLNNGYLTGSGRAIVSVAKITFWPRCRGACVPLYSVLRHISSLLFARNVKPHYYAARVFPSAQFLSEAKASILAGSRGDWVICVNCFQQWYQFPFRRDYPLLCTRCAAPAVYAERELKYAAASLNVASHFDH